MATDKATAKKNLKAHLSPLLNSFKAYLMAESPNGITGDNQPLHITFVLKQDNVQTQGTLKYGLNRQGVCAWCEPDEYVDVCPDGL